MKKFGFRLEKVLKYREGVEQQRELALARAIEAVQAQERELNRLGELSREAMEEMRQMGRGRVDVEGLRHEAEHMAAIRRKTGEATERMKKVEEKSAAARDEFIEARKGRKALEMLRAQRAGQYQQEADTQEQKELDEVGSRPWQGEAGGKERAKR